MSSIYTTPPVPPLGYQPADGESPPVPPPLIPADLAPRHPSRQTNFIRAFRASGTADAAADDDDGASEHVLLSLDDLAELRRRDRSLFRDLHHEAQWQPEFPGQPEQGCVPDHTGNADHQAQGQAAANYQSVASNASNDPETPRVQDAWLEEAEDRQDVLYLTHSTPCTCTRPIATTSARTTLLLDDATDGGCARRRD